MQKLDSKMKKNENSIIQFTKNDVNFLLCKKKKWKAEDVFLFNHELNKLAEIKNELRKNEFLGARFLKNEFNSNLEIGYLRNGKPIFKNSHLQLSISHSKNFIAFAVAPYSIGIDIEECNDRIYKVSDRFLNDSEKVLFNQDSAQELTFAWSAKEALYKLNKDDSLDFKTDLIITYWDKISKLHARMRENSGWKKVNLHSMMYENLVICFNFE